MYVNHVTETEDGTVKFEGELSLQELEAVVSVGLNVLLKTGSLIQLDKTDATIN